MQQCADGFHFHQIKKCSGIMWKDARIIIKADIHPDLLKKSENLAYHSSLQGPCCKHQPRDKGMLGRSVWDIPVQENSTFQFKTSIFSGRVQGFMKSPWDNQLAGFLHIFLECYKIDTLLKKKIFFMPLLPETYLLWTFQWHWNTHLWNLGIGGNQILLLRDV